ncbi:MAG: hypothetical protein D6748_09960 [Calditrichaeota bacterium]|nr:MAG: hypothetical protein D6748_09960 [Calditrichota bacterium]
MISSKRIIFAFSGGFFQLPEVSAEPVAIYEKNRGGVEVKFFSDSRKVYGNCFTRSSGGETVTHGTLGKEKRLSGWFQSQWQPRKTA